MADTLSLIAISAAVGGAVGGATSTFIEKSMDYSSQWLKERFGSHAIEAQASAKENAADFIIQLRDRLDKLETESLLGSDRIVAVEKHPQFSSLMQQSILNSAQTNDQDKHDLLARLISIRMISDSESTVSLASNLAADAIVRCTKRQLHLLALCCFLQDIRPEHPLDPENYKIWVDVFLKSIFSKIKNFEYKQFDISHLVAVNCVTYTRGSEADLDMLLQMKGGVDNIGNTLSESPYVSDLQFMWDEGLAGVDLTSVGSIVGGLSLEQALGSKVGPPIWD